MTTTELTRTELTTTEPATTELAATELTGNGVRGETASKQVVAGWSHAAPYLVVGYDGSGPAQAALDTATRLVQGGEGHLEIVYVAHLSGIVELSPGAVTGMREAFDSIASDLEEEVRVRLRDHTPRWHFQRRNGSVTEQLIAVATELRRQHGADATVIIVGASSQLAHHIAGSVPVALARRAGFPLLVVPSSGCALPPVTGSVAVDPSEYLG